MSFGLRFGSATRGMQSAISSVGLAEGRKGGNEALGVNEVISLLLSEGKKPEVRALGLAALS